MGNLTNTKDRFAIIGLGCRMPPAAGSLDAFWRFLMKGGNALKPIRKDRWDWRQFYDEDPSRPGKSYAPKAAFLDADIQQFDPLAFGISPREANCMDPQQRLLLESAWEAFEDAGIPLERVSGSLTGVFVGGFCLDHLVLQTQPSNRHLMNAQSPAAATMTVLSNRISHAFNLKGPSVTMDTACSSSLVAIHYACQSLRFGDSEMVLAGGVNVMTRPDFPILMSKGHFLSNHGECHAFDETAAGYARGEGAGLFLIKRLEEALEAGDQIHAVICSTGVNQDGHTDGISLPNSDAQEALIREVYRRSGVSPGTVDYVEAHGTGTQAGDPAELRALHVNFSEGRDPSKKLYVGSVKTNIGHLEAAAGVAGMLKAIGVVKFRKVPRNLHFDHPNPKIPFANYCLQVVKDPVDLPTAAEKPVLHVGVNSFGYGGTNAHILVESAPELSVRKARASRHGSKLLPFSANDEKALRDLAGKLAFQAGKGSEEGFADMAYSAAFRRSHLQFRGVAMAQNLQELREQLIAASTGQPHEGVVIASRPAESPPNLVFVYTGMGPQWWAMGRELIESEQIISDTIDEIDGHFQKLAGWSLREAMLAPEASSRMEHTDLAQPANFAIQLALTRLWEKWGIRPAAVVGHSVGEVTSAYVAGIYTLEEAVRISYHRSRLQQTLAGQGAMLAVGLAEHEAQPFVERFPGVSIAAVNSFSAVTLSGDGAQLKEVAAELEGRGVFNKFLRVEVAYHSPQMEPLHEDLLASLADLHPQSPRIPLYSTVHGRQVVQDSLDAHYWWQNVRQAVRFADAISDLSEHGYSAFLEIGPHPVLGNSIKECAAHLERKVDCFVSVRRKEPELPRMLRTLAELYCAGALPDWSDVAPAEGNFIPGPQYPWQRKPYWLESERSRMERFGLPGPVYLNRTLTGADNSWEVEINRNYFPFLFDHGVQDQTVFAGMGYMEAAITLNQRVNNTEAVIIENVSFEKVLIVDYSKLQYLITEFDAAAGRFSISSRIEGEEGSAQRQCRGRIVPQRHPHALSLDLAELKRECAEAVDLGVFYDDLERRGLRYGPAFRPTQEVFLGKECFLVRIDASIVAREKDHLLHPTISDAAIQPILYRAGGDRLYVPFGIEQFHYLSRPGLECYAYGRLSRHTDSMIVADVWLLGPAGEVFAYLRNISCQVISTEALIATTDLEYALEWQEAPLIREENLKGEDVLVLLDAVYGDETLAANLVALLPGAASSGIRRHVIVPIGAKATEEEVSALNEHFMQLLQSLSKNGDVDLTIVTRAAKAVRGDVDLQNLPAASLASMALVAQNELASFRCRSIDFSVEESPEDAARIVAEISAKSRGEIAWRDGVRYEQVLSVRKTDETAGLDSVPVDVPVELPLNAQAKLDDLIFERADRIDPGMGEIELRVHSAAVNYKDVLKAQRHIHPLVLENTFWGNDLGMECSGVVVRSGPNSQFHIGDRVVTILPQAFRSYATIPETFAIRIPDNLGMDAAAIPVVYATAYRGLIELANLKAGERILIHNATGGLGLASIGIARLVGAEIYATAGSEEKVTLLKEMGVERVFPSRSLDFAQAILEATNNEGIDVVIGAQTGQALHAGLNLLRLGGRYIEVGKKDIAEDNDLPLRAFDRNLIYASLDIDRLAKERPGIVRATMEKVFEHFAKGDLQLGATKTYPASQLRNAFEDMARSRHIGKLLVDFSEGIVEVREKPDSVSIIKPDGCYIITGGTAGFGLVTAHWLASQGAGKVLLASRSGPGAPRAREALAEIESLGTKAEALSVDVTDPESVRALIAAATDDAFTLRGVFHGAMVLDDAMLADLTVERFRKVFQPKVAGALNLARALRETSSLDFIVFHSSVSAVVGNRGQTNYVAANSTLDALAHKLRAQGLPAVSVNWGALAESGVVARDSRLVTALSAAGITGLTNREAFIAMEKAIRSGLAQVGMFKVDWSTWLESHPSLAGDPRFRGVSHKAQSTGGTDAASKLRVTLADASKEQRLRAIEQHLQEVLANTLKMPMENVSLQRKLNEMGVDSLMVLELGLGIKERIGVNFSAMEFLRGPNLQQLAAMAEGRLWTN